MTDAEIQLDGFVAKFSDIVADQARTALGRMRQLVPGAISLVYDNYNALAVGFGATEKQAGLVFSIAIYPRWVSLFFSHGIDLFDPHGLLKGEGSRIRHIVLAGVETLDDPRVIALIEQALAKAPFPIDPSRPNLLIIQSISAKQKPRRPSA